MIAAVAAAVALAGTPLQRAVGYVSAHQQPSGGFAEPGASADRTLSAWAALGLGAAGAPADASAARFIEPLARDHTRPTALALGILGVTAAGGRADALLPRLRRLQRRSGAIGPTVNSTIWGVIALRQAGAGVPRTAVRYLVAAQARSGGWSWYRGGAPDSNDTAAAIEALRAGGVSGATVARGLRYLLRLQNRDGGFPLEPGEGSDVQSTAWTIQAFAAAGRAAPRGSLRYLLRLQRSDGSFRYSRTSGITPVWVTAQVLPALAGRPYPLRVRGRAA